MQLSPYCYEHARSFLTMSMERQSYWRQTTSLWCPSLGRPTWIACHHESYAFGFASCDLSIQLVVFLVSVCTQLTHFPMPQSSPQMLTTYWKMCRLKHLCMHLPPTCLLVQSTSNSVLKAIFGRYGVPSVLASVNRPQYNFTVMQEFAALYNFRHITSSPHYPQSNGSPPFPQSNGLAERMVKTAKSLSAKSADPYLALLSYRATPLPWCGLRPADLLMGRHLQTDIPQPKRVFIPDWPYLTSLHVKDEEQKR